MDGLGWQDPVCPQHTNRNWSCGVGHQGHLAARKWGHGVHHIGVYGIHYRWWVWCWHDPGQWAGQLGWSGLGGDIGTHGVATHYLQLQCQPWHSEVVPLLLMLAGSFTMVYASLRLGAQMLSITISSGWASPAVPQSTVSANSSPHRGVSSVLTCTMSDLFPFSQHQWWDLHSSIQFSSMFAHCTRAAALCMPVVSFGTAIASGIPCRTVVTARGVWMGAVGALLGMLLWLALLMLMVLVEGMDGLAAHITAALDSTT